jgi:hypothetical protein
MSGARFEQYPWKLSVIGSSHVPEMTQQEVALEYCAACPKCLDAGFARRLREQTGTSVPLLRSLGIMSPYALKVIRVWVSIHDMHTFDIECMHAHNKLRSCRANKWALIAARCVNAAALSALPLANIGRKALPVVAGAECDRPLVTNGSQLSPHKSALQLFHKRCCQRDSTLGIPGSRISKVYWNSIRKEWSQLSEEQRARYDEEVHLERELAITTGRAHALCDQGQCAPVSSAVVPVVGQDADEASSSMLLSIGGHDGQHSVAAPLAVQRYTDTVENARGDLVLHRPGGLQHTSYFDLHAASFDGQTTGLSKCRGVIPAQVVHDRPCRGLCWRAEQSAWACFEQLEKIIHRKVGEHKDVENLSCVIGFKVTLPDDAVRWHFGLVVVKLGQGTAAVGKASEGWLELAITNPEKFGEGPCGVRLRFDKWEYIVPPRQDKFTRDVSTGRFKFFVSADFLARVVGKSAVHKTAKPLHPSPNGQPS